MKARGLFLTRSPSPRQHPEIDFGYAIGRRPVAEQTIPPTDMGYTPPVNLGYIPNVLFRFEAATGLAISATGADRDDNRTHSRWPTRDRSRRRRYRLNNPTPARSRSKRVC